MERHMKRHAAKGFTLVEMLVSVVLGLLIVGAGVMVYKQAQDSTTYMTQRTVVQGNARTAINQLSQDLNLAGYGLPIAGVVVPSTAIFQCSTGSSGASYAYACPATQPSFPVISSNATLTGVMPGAGVGAILNGKATDQITISYVDASPNNWKDSCGTTVGGVNVVCGFDAYPLTETVVSGATTTLYFDSKTSPVINDKKWGFKLGDVVMVSNGTGQAIGEVTSVTATTVVLGSGDTMKLNQAASVSGSVAAILPSGTANYWDGTGTKPSGTILPSTTASRVNILTYYAQTDPLTQATGTSAQPMRLYRVLNGDSTNNPPVPVAEQISDLTFTYNLFNSICGGSQVANQETLSSTSQIALIKTVNAYVTAASALRSAAMPGSKIQQVPLSTSVSPRNLSFFDSYSSQSNGSC
jgi:prepilin-type N-terminal cleavage/methylation domain-containing protein